MSVEAKETQGRPNTDRIERRIELRASPARVWRAIATSAEFGAWFGMKMDGEFAAGAKVLGRITHPGYEHVTVEMLIERIEPERYFSYRWHPNAVDTSVDYTDEPTTLVEFTLQETDEGTTVTIVESGFDRIPLARRDEAFRMNERGWDGEIRNLERYVG